MIGVLNFTLEENREMHISDTASNSIVVNGDVVTYPDGKICLFLCLAVLKI